MKRIPTKHLVLPIIEAAVLGLFLRWNGAPGWAQLLGFWLAMDTSLLNTRLREVWEEI